MSDDLTARAKVIARAFAHTAAHHRKTAVVSGVVALGGCALAYMTAQEAAKGVALIIAVVFAVFCYRATRLANTYVDPSASPVLQAIATAPERIVAIAFDAARSVVMINTETASLEVRIDDSTPAGPLIDALAEHAPDADVTRDTG